MMGSFSSNWSAPKEETQGLMPPIPSANRYRLRKNTPDCAIVVVGQSVPVHEGGFKNERDADNVSVAIQMR